MATAPVLASVKDIAWSMPQAPASAEVAARAPLSATAAVTADAVHVAFEAPQISFNFEYPQAVAKTFEAPAAHAEAPDLSETFAKIVEDAQTSNRPRALFGIQLGANGGRGNSGGQAATKKPPAPPQQPSAAAARPREAVTKARMEAYAQSHEIMREQMLARGTQNHPWALVYHTKDVQGTRGLLDAMELVVLKQGSLKMQMWLAEMSKNEDTAVALSAIFGSAAEAAADRLLGILLLITDGQGGRSSVSEAFHKMSSHVEGSLRFAHFLETASKDPIGGRGLSELLDTLTAPQGDHEWVGAAQLAETWKNVSFTVGGARRLNQTWQNLTELEGGNALIARLLQRMSRTSDGAIATLETLHNLAHDNEGAAQLGRVLARASESREGARDVLKALQAMTSQAAGQRECVRLLVRLAEGGELGRLLATLSKDSLNAYALGTLLHTLSQSSGGRKLVRFSLERTAFGRQKSSYQMFVARMSRCEGMSIPGLDFTPTCVPVEFSVPEKAFF
jgi:hypothetical protein